MQIYVNDGQKHDHGSFFDRKKRDEIVKKLRKEGWEVEVGHYDDIDGSGEIFWYDAIKQGGKNNA